MIVAGVVTIVGVAMQAGSDGKLAVMYVGRFVAGLGVGAASMLVPIYGVFLSQRRADVSFLTILKVSECSPRAIRGGLTGKTSSEP